MTGFHFEQLTPRFRRIARDAVRSMETLRWPDRLFFLAAAGEKHETWRKTYAEEFVDERVPEWAHVVSAVIELWDVPQIGGFEIAAIYTSSNDKDWRVAGEAWCVANGLGAALADYWSAPQAYSEALVERALGRLDRLVG